MEQGGSVPEGHRTITSRTQTLPQSTSPIIPTTMRIAGRTGGTGETDWAPGQVTTATRDTATTTILTTTTTAAAVAEEAAMTGTGTEIEIETEIGTETVTTPIALTPDTIPTPTARPLTACLLRRHLTLHTPPKSLPLPLLRDWMFPTVQGAQALQRGVLCPL